MEDKANKPTLFIICGMPASGKTTLATEIVETFAAFHLSEDEWMKELIGVYDNDLMRDNIAQLHRKIASRLLTKGVNIVMDGGYYSKQERESLRNIAMDADVNVELHYLKTDFSILNARRIKRNKTLAPEFHTTEENIKKAKHSFQEPDESEKPIMYLNNNRLHSS